MSLSPEQVEEIARAARAAVEEAAKPLVAEAVKQTLLQLGMDATNPIEMQKDMQHLREWRKAGEDLKGKGLFILLSIFITGVVGLIVVGVKEWFSGG